ncbi:MAG TPA: hypothetical protein VFE88_01400 [Candidatus Nanoarchaeia archaeon]|nr:hypothetical protein [Candidatus Nanoarchaeia archaeon]
MKAKVPIKPTKWERFRSWLHVIICIILGVLLIFGAIHLLSYYIYLLTTKGFFDTESIKIGTYIIIGAFFFLVIYKKDIEGIFKIKSWSNKK